MTLFLCRDIDVLIRACITYVHLLLEYCSPVWSPSSKTFVDQLESKFDNLPNVKRLPGLHSVLHMMNAVHVLKLTT